jgi:nifR3 family TIM-barrel protein
MVSANGLILGAPKTRRLCHILPKERPLGLQLFGADPEIMLRAAAAAMEFSPDLVDINLGCPVRKIRRQGAGSALLEDPARAAEVVAAAVEGSSRPVTVKLRLGPYKDQLEKILPPLLAAGAVGVCLHARTTNQLFAGKADWAAIARLKSWCPVPVVGNGDVTSGREAVRMLAETGCDAVMIGRAARGDPWIFARALAHWQGRPVPEVNVAQRREALWKHVALARELGGEGHAVHFMKQFMVWYSRGLPGASEFRRQVGAAQGLAGLENLAQGFFEAIVDSPLPTTEVQQGGRS